ncbi:hypothetical protein CHU_1950 [Cytophaga hutchinsonii ATCC 33406]|uniref:Uncharacterized protein n=1 Tax=Cytophaga hutchinsonii (strain ATCC 33406 / DSM 1761 / CIP 103989 / NBRC 15051 / NCIMB 9469 / D465) TaxID=269798 RepID=A0A6N4SS62_CYTH3|nr:hypothetical protein CHU_1950 [Cytophaga hutchinsonii ATCC 33406]
MKVSLPLAGRLFYSVLIFYQIYQKLFIDLVSIAYLRNYTYSDKAVKIFLHLAFFFAPFL